jgi:hypothetical protein
MSPAFVYFFLVWVGCATGFVHVDVDISIGQ